MLCNSPSFWKTICFSAEHAPKLTDAHLARLLLRVNAKTHTAHLSLRGCTRVTGDGLEPLRFSAALVSIDLRVTLAARGRSVRAAGGGAALDPFRVTSILKSMLPMGFSPYDDEYRLDRIHIHSLRRRPLSAVRGPELERVQHRQWVALMRWASAAREQREPVVCGHCHHPCDETGPLGVLECCGCGVVTCRLYESHAHESDDEHEGEGGHGHGHSHSHALSASQQPPQGGPVHASS